MVTLRARNVFTLSSLASRSWSLLGIGLLMAAAPVMAQYKVVGPDGKISYTDRPPVGAKTQPISTGGAGGGTVSTNNLPYELKQVVSRFPVTLYTNSDCSPCDDGRALLKQRGIPFTERTASSPDDMAALKRLEGADTFPILRIGGQQLKGFSSSDWNDYLTTAGYPKQSALPADYVAATPTPLAPKAASAANTGAASSRDTTPAPSKTAPSGIRF